MFANALFLSRKIVKYAAVPVNLTAIWLEMDMKKMKKSTEKMKINLDNLLADKAPHQEVIELIGSHGSVGCSVAITVTKTGFEGFVTGWCPYSKR